MGIGKEHMDGISLDTALLFKYFRGLTTGGERKRVEDWMQISEENEKTAGRGRNAADLLENAALLYRQGRGDHLSRGL